MVLFGDKADIGAYLFSHRIRAKTFCKHCGIVMTNAHNPLSDEEHAARPENIRAAVEKHKHICAVNARVLTDVDVKRLRWARLDGATIHPPPYVNP